MKKILVINLMYIGDLLFATPVLRSFHEAYPEAELTLLVDTKNAAVVRYNPHLSRLIEIDKKGYHGKWKHFGELIAELRREKFDLVVNLHRNERSSALAAFSGGKRIVGFSKPGFSLFFDQVMKERRDIHQVSAYLEILKKLRIPLADHGLEMWIDKDSVSHAEQLWREKFALAVGKEEAQGRLPVIGINTGGSWPTKRWTHRGFAELADRLLAAGYGVAFFGGPMDKTDVFDILHLMRENNSSRLAVFTGRTTILEMAALVRNCRLLVTGDSGPMHIAVSQRVPVLALFGPSDPVRYAPYKQEDAVIVMARDCLACGQHDCGGHECMEEITADTVWQKIREKIG